MQANKFLLDVLKNAPLDETQDDAYVAEKCAQHPDLIETTKKRLAQVRVHRAKVKRSSASALPSEKAASSLNDNHFAPPGYEIITELQRGGMGVVYQAKQLGFGRDVALKMILSGQYAHPSARKRFRSEAEAIAKVQHANIVQVFQVGEHNGLPFFSMEFMAGGSLAEKLANAPLPPRQAAALVEKVARAMQVAHDRHVVHRDLKPANILLTSDGVPKIADFGVAKKLDSEGNTEPGAVLGTPSYMAPEQAAGKLEDIGEATDVYALGAILYECLTGHPPFKAATALETQSLVLYNEPVSPRYLQPQCPRDLETICLKCLEKAAAARYESASALADDLTRFLAGEPIHARPAGAFERTWRWCRRKPAWATAISAASLAAVAIPTILVVALILIGNSRDEAIDSGKKTKTALDEKENNYKELVEVTLKRRKALQLSSGLALDRGLNLYEQGRIADGMLWLARSLEIVPEDDAENQHTIRTNLAVMHESFQPLRAVLEHPKGASRAAISPDSKKIVTAGGDGARLWDAVTGEVIEHLPHKYMMAVAFSPDSKLVLTGSADKTARLWDATNGKPVCELLEHSYAVTVVGFSPDGAIFFTAGEGNHPNARGGIRLWDTSSKRSAAIQLQSQCKNVEVAAISSESKFILAVCNSESFQFGVKGDIHVWEIATGKPVSQFFHPFHVWSAVFSPDGKKVLTTSGDRTARLWDASTGEGGEPLEHKGQVMGGVFSPDGKNFITLCEDLVRIWEMGKTRPIAELSHIGKVRVAAFDTKGTRILTATENGVAQIWNVATARRAGPAISHGRRIGNAILSPDGGAILTMDDYGDERVRFWDVLSDRSESIVLTNSGPISKAALSADGQLAIAEIESKANVSKAYVWEVSSGKLLWESPLLQAEGGLGISRGGAEFGTDGKVRLTFGHRYPMQLWDALNAKPLSPKVAAISLDGKRIATREADHVVRVRDAATSKEIGKPIQLEEYAIDLVFGVDGRSLLSMLQGPGAAYRVQIWDIESGVGIGQPLLQQGLYERPKFSPDGKVIITTGRTGSRSSAQLWDAKTGNSIGAPIMHEGDCDCLAFSPDGKTLLTGSGRDKNAKLFATTSGEPIGKQLGHLEGIISAKLSPDGSMAVTGSIDKTARVWDAKSGVAIGSPLQHRDWVTHVSFSSNGKLILTVADKKARLWDVATGKPLMTPVWNDGDIYVAEIGPDSRTLLRAGEKTAQLWKVPPPLSGTAYRVVLWTQVVTGMELDDNGVAQAIDVVARQERRHRLQKLDAILASER